MMHSGVHPDFKSMSEYLFKVVPLGFIRKSCESLENCGGVKNMKFASES